MVLDKFLLGMSKRNKKSIIPLQVFSKALKTKFPGNSCHDKFLENFSPFYIHIHPLLAVMQHHSSLLPQCIMCSAYRTARAVVNNQCTPR